MDLPVPKPYQSSAQARMLVDPYDPGYTVPGDPWSHASPGPGDHAYSGTQSPYFQFPSSSPCYTDSSIKVGLLSVLTSDLKNTILKQVN